MNISHLILSNKLVQNTIASIFFRLSVLIMGLIFARNLGTDFYGEFVLVRSTVQIFETALGISLGIAVSKVFLINRENFRDVINSSLFFIVIIASLVSFLFIFVFDISNFTGGNIIIIVFYGFLTIFFQFLLNFLKGIAEFKLVFIVSFVYLVSSIFVSYYLTLSISGANGALISYIVILLISFATMLTFGFKWFLKFDFDFRFNLVDTVKFYKTDALPVMLSAMLSPLVLWLVNVLVASGQNGTHNLSLFNVSYLLYGLMTFFPVVLAEVFFKKIAEELNSNSNVMVFIYKYAIRLLIANVPLALFFYYFSDDIVLLYGEEFSGSVQSFRLFIFCSFLTCTLPLLGKLFILGGMSFFNFISNFIWGTFVLIFIYLGKHYLSFDIPLLCAISFFVSYFIILVMQWSIAYKRFAR
ncbi:hypothetical protein [Vibrio misgurnus]|uniref:hypothetical protein n=1 Tax=Vibrio misgurnus TaxID=2993714 RepID=UPI00241800BF|nr:hypothetical protein [Vibrio sp. gvc]